MLLFTCYMISFFWFGLCCSTCAEGVPRGFPAKVAVKPELIIHLPSNGLFFFFIGFWSICFERNLGWRGSLAAWPGFSTLIYLSPSVFIFCLSSSDLLEVEVCSWRCVYDSLGVELVCLANCNSFGSIYLPLWLFCYSSFGFFRRRDTHFVKATAVALIE